MINFSGHDIYYDKLTEEWRYSDTKELVEIDRPCIRCKQKPTKDGRDYCIANLGAVLHACCGHGVKEGYIHFDNGITIRGYFKIEKEELS